MKSPTVLACFLAHLLIVGAQPTTESPVEAEEALTDSTSSPVVEVEASENLSSTTEKSSYRFDIFADIQQSLVFTAEPEEKCKEETKLKGLTQKIGQALRDLTKREEPNKKNLTFVQSTNFNVGDTTYSGITGWLIVEEVLYGVCTLTTLAVDSLVVELEYKAMVRNVNFQGTKKVEEEETDFMGTADNAELRGRIGLTGKPKLVDGDDSKKIYELPADVPIQSKEPQTYSFEVKEFGDCSFIASFKGNSLGDEFCSGEMKKEDLQEFAAVFFDKVPGKVKEYIDGGFTKAFNDAKIEQEEEDDNGSTGGGNGRGN